MTATTISNIPRDLLEEIISRVPLKLMKAVRSTCKSWNKLFESESFTKLHISKVKSIEGDTMMIALMPFKCRNLYLMRAVVDYDDPSIELKGKLSLFQNQTSFFHDQVCIHEGLLLCIWETDAKILVLNPYLGQTRSIKIKNSHSPPKNFMCYYALGYAYKESRRNFKILRFFNDGTETPERRSLWYEMYDSDFGLWTTLDVTLTPRWHWACRVRTSVSLKGNAYWWVRKENSKCKADHIICFDFTREKFGPLLPLPPVNDTTANADVYVSLFCVKEEKLAAFFYDYYSGELEIWITTKIETETVSWSMFLRMDYFGPSACLPSSSLVDEEKKAFMCFDRDLHSDSGKIFAKIIGEAREYSKIRDLEVLQEVADEYYWPKLCSYVPSSIQIKEPARGKRKR